MRGLYFQCENCKQKIFDTFPLEWMHIAVMALQVGRGCYTEGDLSYAEKYSQYRNLTFCSMQCYFEWFKNTYPNYQNPSQRRF